MGLHLSARLAELLGARIELRSTPGEGSCFSLVFDRLAPSSPSA
jgi:signal transduction histidine kinase